MGAQSSDEPWRGEPATDRQKKKLRFFGVPIKRGLTKNDASDLITAAVESHPEIEARYEAAKEEEERLWFLDETINDEDAREMGDYKKLTKAQLKELLAHLSQHAPDWERMDRMRLVAIVVKLFPQQLKVQRPKRSSARRGKKASGCLGLLLALLSTGIVVILLLQFPPV